MRRALDAYQAAGFIAGYALSTEAAEEAAATFADGAPTSLALTLDREAPLAAKVCSSSAPGCSASLSVHCFMPPWCGR
jgi:hypothetical protein